MLLLIVFLSIPAIQTKLAKLATEKINQDFGTDLVIKKVDLSLLGAISLKGIEIRDHHKDTLIFIDKLSTALLNAKRALNGNVNLKSISLDGVNFHIKTYKGEMDDNLSVFTDSFEDEPTPQDDTYTPFILRTSDIYLENLNFKLIDENDEDPFLFGLTDGGGNLRDFSIVGPNVAIKIRGLYFTDNKDIEITNLTTDFAYSKTQMQFYNTMLRTQKSKIEAEIEFHYKKENLKYFNDSVAIAATFKLSSISVEDVKKLYDELDGNDVLHFSGIATGFLNDFKVTNLDAISDQGTRIVGNMDFKNVVNTEKGFVFDGELENITTRYIHLKKMLPNLLGKSLPSAFINLGEFTLEGKTKITSSDLSATVTIVSEIGTTVADLEITDIDTAEDAHYNGEIGLIDFGLGRFFKNPLLGNISFKGDIKGSGFLPENINTTLTGKVSEFEFKGYPYQNILIDGRYKNNLFDGTFSVDDENLKMSFKGLADIISEEHQFDFNATIAYADLKTTNLYVKDSISELKGTIDLDIRGNQLNSLIGVANFKNIEYINHRKKFSFKQFLIFSTIKDTIKQIRIDSEDIVKGELTGNFTFEELLPLAQNAFGNIYTNYHPYKVKPHQFINFDFSVYSQAVDVFFPNISIDNNTKVRGFINADNNRLKLTISSPKIIAYGNEIDQFLLRTDTKNELYNSQLIINKLSTKQYSFSKLNLLNKTVNDTLFFKSVFRGGANDNEKFNVDFFYTINNTKKSVLGIQKSTFNFRDHNWSINPDNNANNKVTFDLNTKEYTFSPFLIKSGKQQVNFKGSLRDSTYKNLQVDFTEVALENFLPAIDSLKMKGQLNGSIDFIQKKGVYNPGGNLVINHFKVNDFVQGNLAVNVEGNNSYEKYNVGLSLEKEGVKSIATTGDLDFSNARPTIDLSVFLEDFKLNAFSPLGKDVLSKIRGSASGNFTLKGFLRNPDMNGGLVLKGAGLKFPYLNTDYDFEGTSLIGLKGQSFILNDITLLDTKHHTRGILSGAIIHQNFDAWVLDIKIDTDNLLVMDTENTEEAQYYGTAFIKGAAEITGLTDKLDIIVNGKTEKNTLFVIPLKDIATVESYKLIHFNSGTLSEDRQKELALEAIEGVSLFINLEVTKDAIAQVVIDEVNGSELKGSGAGDLQIEIDTRGTFNMYGDFTIDNGFYNLKYGGVVNKPFAIVKGSTVSWSGDPYNADLNVTALYTTKANPAVLLENFNTNRKIDVNLITKITGGLFNSKQEFDIQIPNSNSTIESELDFVLNDNNKNAKMRQFFSLLVFGSFMELDRANIDGNNLIAGTTSNLVGSILSDIISSRDDKVKINLDYKQGTPQNVENDLATDNTFEASLTTQISDRIIINGKVGVPVGAQTQSSVVGEVKVEVLLNKNGTFKGVIFNRQNEIQYSTQEEGYTQGAGLNYQVNFNTLSELLQKIGLKKKPKKKTTPKKEDTAKAKKRTLINFKNKELFLKN
ncbi:MAG: translocation/assembly module TamB [Flavobacteriaceae bacterium]|nr:MAG: translocation/assembly module TamB [Flavobacteriaceae bacterium]